MSLNGPAFYQLPVNKERLVLQKMTWTVPDSLPFGKQNLIPFKAGEALQWKVVLDD